MPLKEKSRRNLLDIFLLGPWMEEEEEKEEEEEGFFFFCFCFSVFVSEGGEEKGDGGGEKVSLSFSVCG